jgi:hypothetical protein
MRPVDQIYDMLFSTSESGFAVFDAADQTTKGVKHRLGVWVEQYRQLVANMNIAVDEGVAVQQPYKIPGPYEIALTIGAALAASGKYENPGAAMAAAWASVPEFYQARDQYLNETVPIFYGGEIPEPTPLTNEPIGGLVTEGMFTPEHEFALSRAMAATSMRPPETQEELMQFLSHTPEEHRGDKFPDQQVAKWERDHEISGESYTVRE